MQTQKLPLCVMSQAATSSLALVELLVHQHVHRGATTTLIFQKVNPDPKIKLTFWSLHPVVAARSDTMVEQCSGIRCALTA